MPEGVHTVKAEARMHDTLIYDRQALYITKAVDAPGFRSTVETPLMLGMSQYCDQWRSHKLAEVLSTSGIGIPYKESNNA